MMPIECYIGLGSNLGDSEHHLYAGLTAIDALEATSVVEVSPLFVTAPVGPQDQPDFLNAVAVIVTELPALTLLDALKDIEQQLGRTPTRRWGERVIDLDILHYGDQIIHTDTLAVPHPGIGDRAFVLVPLHAIAAQLVLADGRRVESLYRACNKDGVRYHGEAKWRAAD